MNPLKEVDGATPERLTHGHVITEVRQMTIGGMVTSAGHRDTMHCYLDFMKLHNQITDDEYDSGYRLRHLYFSFTQSAKALLGESGGAKELFTSEQDIGSYQDIAETMWHKIMSLLGKKARLIRFICIEDISPCIAKPDFIAAARDGLSRLHDYFEIAQKDVDGEF